MPNPSPRVYSQTFGMKPTHSAPDQAPPKEPELCSRDEIRELLPNLGTPEALAQAITDQPQQTFQLLHSALSYHKSDLASCVEKFNQLEIDSSNQQERLNEQLQEQEITMNGYQDQINDLNQALVKSRTITGQAPTQAQTPSSPAHRSAKHPDPPYFDGARSDLDAFIYKLEAKLSANADWYPDTLSKINYAYGRLEGKAEKQILPRMNRANAAAIRNMDDFFQALQTCFGDPDKKFSAQQFIFKLKQANKPFSEYLAAFQAHIGDTGFDESNQLYHFRMGLSRELTNYLITMNTEEMSMDTLIKTCHKLDNAYRQMQSQNPGANPRRLPTTTTSTATTTAVHTSNNDGNTAMDLSKIQSRPRGPLTAQEKQRRRDNNLCLYCAEKDHQAINCPRKANTKANIRTVDLASPAADAQEIDGQAKQEKA